MKYAKIDSRMYRVQTSTYSYLKEKPKNIITRLKPFKRLSNRQLKRKLYAAGFRRTNLKCILQKIKSIISTTHETTNYDITALSKELNEKLVRRLTKFIRIRYVILDEFWNMMPSNNLANYMGSFRSHRVHTITVTQTLADFEK